MKFKNKILSIFLILIIFSSFPFAYNISIKLEFVPYFAHTFQEGAEWEDISKDDVKNYIINVVRSDYSDYNIPVSTNTGNLVVYIGKRPYCDNTSTGIAYTGIGSYLLGNAESRGL